MLYPQKDIDKNNNPENKEKKDLFWIMENRTNIDDVCISEEQKEKINHLLKNKDLEKRWLNLWDILKLSWFFEDTWKITKLDIENNVEWIYKIFIESFNFDEIVVHIELENNCIKIDRFIANKFRANNWIGSKTITNMVYYAKNKWFEKIYTTAAKISSLDKKYKNKWYHFFPKLWFLIVWDDLKKPKIMKRIKQNPDFSEVNNINELLLMNDEDWNRIWLEFWKKIWNSALMEFDLQEWSESMNILKSYIKNKETKKG